MSSVKEKYISTLMFPVFVMFFVLISYFNAKVEGLEIIAFLSPETDSTWVLTGRILDDGEPVDSASVWAILRSANGNRNTPPAKTTNEMGEFTIPSLNQRMGQDEVKEIRIFAKAQKEDSNGNGSIKMRGKVVLTIRGEGSFRTVSVNIWPVIFLPAIFLISIIIPFLRKLPKEWKYNFSILFAFLFTVTMIFTILVSLATVNGTSDKSETLSLGFASMFHGTYDKRVPPEWLFSLTSRKGPNITIVEGSIDATDNNTSAGGANIETGFGAPLWVMLLAVIGASLITIYIIVEEIKDQPDFDKLDISQPEEKDLKKFRMKIEKITRHQFYILFSPLGAIFVYQLLVVADAASQNTTVALAALGAGASLNYILGKGIKASKSALDM